MTILTRTLRATSCAWALVISSGCFQTSDSTDNGAGDASSDSGSSDEASSGASESGASETDGGSSGTPSGDADDDTSSVSSNEGDTSSDSSSSTSETTSTSTSTSTSGTDEGDESTTQASTSRGTDGDDGSGEAADETGSDVEATDETGSDVSFEPCPQTGPCKILPLGDSITFGLGFDGGYRVELFRLALADGHEITFTGTQAPNGPSMVDGTPFPRNHEGISGETIEQIGNRVPNPALGDPPHIILLHAGTNDMVGNNAATAPDRLETLLDELISEAPDALLVVSNIIPLSFGGGSVDAFNATVEPMVEQRAAAGAHIVFADQFTGFPTNELGDGVHPNEAGYARMAGVWYDAIEAFLR